MKWPKRLIAVGAAALLATAGVMLSACSKQDKTSANGKVTIEYFNQKTEMVDTLKEIIKDFEKENPKIHVKMTSVPSAGTVLKTRMLAGDAPDVINIYPQNVDFKEWAKAGYFENMTGKSYLKNIKNHYEKNYAVNGKIYSVPLSANVSGIYFNKTKFEELGLKVPETWDEFETLVKQIKADGETPFALAGSEGWTLNGYHQLAYISVTGSGDKANDYLRFSPVNSISTKDKEVKEVLTRLDLLAGKGNQQTNWEGASYNDSVVAFATEKTLMLPGGSWVLAAIKQQDPNFEISTFAFPGEKAGQEVTVGAGDLALSISSKTKHKKECEQFISYMASAKAMQKYYDVDGSPVSVNGVAEDENSPLAPLYQLAFTDKHYVWLGENWTSEDDFFSLTANYLLNQDANQYVSEMNAFFNPMKADVDK
ncbi:extracellular solute-binding protein [Streptococcus ruminicola]|uniref:Raffinose/stachyose/melibiose transport system substrate-binding protein n=2 Tax=Streptococcus TaxID=1301 RepID=A0A091BN78_STREI|nr:MULTISPECIES: extracellular solute-binding protein [Streptococcus]KFN85875.1 sugar ABC transporter substrate-binding protein [Streptococcus equinus JB1]QGZ28289.1 extracellular solute-binding protein [Streptococcus ruminicola]QIM46524.1 extracellular solute-binding protein [Streptococcus ruminicola]SFL48983.1 raffinose/stachyose/melibiose transport system substrate-binding protein [Streptococcus equinus JB1]